MLSNFHEKCRSVSMPGKSSLPLVAKLPCRVILTSAWPSTVSVGGDGRGARELKEILSTAIVSDRPFAESGSIDGSTGVRSPSTKPSRALAEKSADGVVLTKKANGWFR